MTDENNILPIGIKPRQPDEKMLTLVSKPMGCLDHAYLIDEKAGTVTCRRCKQSFDPMQALLDLARKESRWMQNYEDYKDRMRRLDERRSTKCQHCKQMTRIRGE